AAAVTNNHRELSARNPRENFVLNGFVRNVMAGVQDNQILNAANNFPVANRIDLALVASVEPTIAQNFRGFVRTVPVSGENIRPADNNLAIFGGFHFNSTDGGTNTAGFNVEGIVHGTDGSGFRKSVNLKHRDAEHHEEKLSFDA